MKARREKVTIGRIWGIIYPMLIYIGVTYAVMMVMMIGIAVYGIASGACTPNELENYLYNTVMGQSTLMLLTMLAGVVTIPFMIFFYRKDIKRDKINNTFEKFERVNPAKYLLIVPFGIFTMMWANMFVSLLQMIMPEFMVNSYTDTADAIYGSSVLVQFITAGIVAPIVEEMIFRGLIYKRTKKMTGMIAAAIISSLLFGVFHGNWVQAPYAFFVGICCVFVYEKYKSVVAPIILHMAANCLSVFMVFIASGESADNTVALEAIEPIEYVMSILFTLIVMLILAFITGVIIYVTVHPQKIHNLDMNIVENRQEIFGGEGAAFNNPYYGQNSNLKEETEEPVDMENTFYYQRRDKNKEE